MDKLAKHKRIEELHLWGLNTPNMLVHYLNKFGEPPNTYQEIMEFLCNREIVNVRTFKMEDEGFNNPHFLQISSSDALCHIIKLLTDGYAVMVEDFSPRYTIYNGNLMVFNGKNKWAMDYCVGRNKTVRMADKFITGTFDDLYSGRLPRELSEIIHLGYCFSKIRPVILEWSWSIIPQGRRKENAIFWEYRSANKSHGI